MELPAWLTKKVGPFPVGVWVLIGGAGVGAVYFIRKRTGSGGDGFMDNEASDMYGVPIDSPDDTYPDAPSSPPPYPSGQPGTGGYVLYPPYTEPLPGEPAPADVPVPVVVPATCTQATLPARHGAYPDAPNRDCPNGWHRANQGPCVGKCIRNAG